MELKKVAPIGILALLVVSCGVAPFGYKHYNLKPDKFDGKLEADKPENDLPLSQCADTETEKNRCQTMFTRDFFQLKEEVLQLRERVKCLEKGTCQ